jgi:hypothetical protein
MFPQGAAAAGEQLLPHVDTLVHAVALLQQW